MILPYPAQTISTAEGFDRQKCVTKGCNEPAGLLSPYCHGCRNELAALTRSTLSWSQKLVCMGVALALGIIAVVIWNFAYYGTHPVTTTLPK